MTMYHPDFPPDPDTKLLTLAEAQECQVKIYFLPSEETTPTPDSYFKIWRFPSTPTAEDFLLQAFSANTIGSPKQALARRCALLRVTADFLRAHPNLQHEIIRKVPANVNPSNDLGRSPSDPTPFDLDLDPDGPDEPNIGGPGLARDILSEFSSELPESGDDET